MLGDQMMKMVWLRIAFLLALLSPSLALSQGAILQGGPTTDGHVPQYVGSGSGQTIVNDGGAASGGPIGANASELGLVARGTGTPPYSGQGTGPFGSTLCSYDAPTSNPTGYHFLCLSPNATGGNALISYGAGGAATPGVFNFDINGQTIPFPPTGVGLGNVVGPVSTTVGNVPGWGNTAGTLLTPNAQVMELLNAAPLGTIDLQTVVPANGFYVSGSGAIFQNCPLTGCVAGDHEQAALYLKATARFDKSIAEYMAIFDCNLNSGSTGVPVGISDNKACFFNSTVTGPLSGNATWGMANDLEINVGDTGLFKVGAEFDITNSAADCAVGVRNCYDLFLSGIVGNPITAYISIGAPVGTVATAAHFGIVINGAKMDSVDIENSGTAPVGICNGCLVAGAHSISAIQDKSTAPIGLWLNGTYSGAAIQLASGAKVCFELTDAVCLAWNNAAGALTSTFTFAAPYLQNQAISTIGALPTCNAANLGVRTIVSNGAAGPALGSTVSATGAVVQPVMCSGASGNWVYG